MPQAFRLALAASAVLLACGSTIDVGKNGTPAASGGTTTGSLDGTWDITAAGDAQLGPSEMTVHAGSVTGFVVNADEGTTVGSCTFTKHRTEFTLNVQGDSVTSTRTELRESSGSGCSAPSKNTSVASGTRTRVAPASDTDLNGDWEIQATGSRAVLFKIQGLSGNATDPMITVSVAGNLASVAANDKHLQFAARRR